MRSLLTFFGAVLCCGVLAAAQPTRADGAPARAQAPLTRETLPTYPQNPVRTPQPTRLAAPLPIAGATLTHSAVRVRTCVSTHNQPCQLVAVAARDATGQFRAAPLATPSGEPDAFAELSAFYHAARTLAYFAALPQFTAKSRRSVPAARLELVVGAVLPAHTRNHRGGTVVSTPRSFYLGPAEASSVARTLRKQLGIAGPLVWLGFGAHQNLAYDGDTVVHETAHSVLHPQRAPRWQLSTYASTNEASAVAEALADYFTAAITGDPLIGEYVSSVGVRDLRGHGGLPFATGEPHQDGLALARLLWHVRSQVEPNDLAVWDAFVSAAASAPTCESFLQHLRAQLVASANQLAPLLPAALQPTSPCHAPRRSRDADNDHKPPPARAEPLAAQAPAHPHFIEVIRPGAAAAADLRFLVPGRQSFVPPPPGPVPAAVQYRIAVPTDAIAVRGSLVALPHHSPWDAPAPQAPRSRASSGVPQVAQPPLALVARWDAPLTWPWPRAQQARPTTVPIVDGVFDVPRPAEGRILYLQVVNHGASEAAYKQFVVSFITRATSPASAAAPP